MVYNFANEVDDIKDRYLLHLFGNDLFHDGYIFETTFLNDVRDVQLVISCERDWAVEHDVVGGIPPGKKVPDDRFDDRFRYILIFKDCQYFVREALSFPIEYLNGRFKDSARLAIVKSQSQNRRKYHHLRIQTHNGYLDLIFSGFSASKLAGEIKLPHRVERIRSFAAAIEKYKGMEIEEVRKIARTGEDFYRGLALQYLCHINDPAIIDLSIANVQIDDAYFREGAIAAIYALGKYGNMEVIPHLMRSFDREIYPSHLPIARRHVEDAIEMILHRLAPPKQVGAPHPVDPAGGRVV